MFDIYKGAPAEWLGVQGELTRIDLGGRNVWWRADTGDTEIMFSLRGDGVWRSFPGRADAEGLLLLGFAPAQAPRPTRDEACKNGHKRTEANTAIRRRTRNGVAGTHRYCLICERAKNHRKTLRKQLTLV